MARPVQDDTVKALNRAWGQTSARVKGCRWSDRYGQGRSALVAPTVARGKGVDRLQGSILSSYPTHHDADKAGKLERGMQRGASSDDGSQTEWRKADVRLRTLPCIVAVKTEDDGSIEFLSINVR